MDNKELLLEIEYLYNRIIEIEKYQNEMISKNTYSQHIKTQEDYDYIDIYDRLIGILVPMIENYRYIFKTTKREKAKKVYFVAICEMVKQDYYRGMLITFKNVTNIQNLNTNNYYDLLTEVSESQKIQIIKKKNVRRFEDTYILETGIPKNHTNYVLKMFKIYWRYFRKFSENERLELIQSYLKGEELKDQYIIDYKDAKEFEVYRDKLKDFPQKTIRVFSKLDTIFKAFDEFSGEISKDNYEKISEKISQEVGFNISKVLRDSDLKKIYFTYLMTMSITRFQKIIDNLPYTEAILCPDGVVRKQPQMAKSEIVCGEYKIRGNKYFVVIDPNISLEDMLSNVCGVVKKLAKDYYCYFSRKDFDIVYNGYEKNTIKVLYKSQTRYIWFGKLNASDWVNVDGHKIYAEERFKFNFRICKKFDYDNKVNDLQLILSEIKLNDPLKAYKQLSISINSGEPERIAVGDDKGLVYRDNYRKVISDYDYVNVAYSIENEVFEEKIELKNFYVFDKWNGTEYIAGKNNEKHSGSLIIFSRKKLEIDTSLFLVEKEYLNGIYFVYEIKCIINSNIFTLENEEFSFEKNNKPCIFLKNNYDENISFENINQIVIKTLNLQENTQYRIQVSNSLGSENVEIINGEYQLNSLLSSQVSLVTGKWNISLWEKQIKVDTINFNILPNFEIKSKIPSTLENKDVEVIIKASENCFLNSFGEYSDTTILNIGKAILIEENGEYRSKLIENSIYIDSHGCSKNITFIPNVWGIRKNIIGEEKFESPNNLISLKYKEIKDTNLFVISTSDQKLKINGVIRSIQKGKNKFELIKEFSQISKKNSFVIEDEKEKINYEIACNPDFEYKRTEFDETVNIVIKYEGPIFEGAICRVFIENQCKNKIVKDINENICEININIGHLNEILNKKAIVDINTIKNQIPIKVFDDIISRPENTVNIFREIVLSEFNDVKKLVDYYHSKVNKENNFITTKSIIENIRKEFVK